MQSEQSGHSVCFGMHTVASECPVSSQCSGLYFIQAWKAAAFGICRTRRSGCPLLCPIVTKLCPIVACVCRSGTRSHCQKASLVSSFVACFLRPFELTRFATGNLLSNRPKSLAATKNLEIVPLEDMSVHHDPAVDMSNSDCDRTKMVSIVLQGCAMQVVLQVRARELNPERKSQLQLFSSMVVTPLTYRLATETANRTHLHRVRRRLVISYPPLTVICSD